MRYKAILFALLLTSSIVTFGCSNDELEEPSSRNYETYTGEFKSLAGIRVNKTISHLFETDDGDILYTYSDRYDLDDEAYFNQRVEAYGVVMVYDDLDKEVFEVRRITEADEVDEEDVEINEIEYKDSELGFSITYPDNWKFSALRDSIRLDAPEPKLEEDEELPEDFQADYIIIAQRSDVSLTTTGDDSDEDRVAEIKTALQNSIGVTGQTASIGVDGQVAVKYKVENEFEEYTSYFVPRNNELLEISFVHLIDSENDKVANGIIFSEIVSTFRFLPYGGESTSTTTEEEQVEEVVEEVVEEAAPTTSQTSVKGYREFTSNPFNFRISYPSDWYYSGGSSGYDFNNEPIEDDVTPIIRLDINSKSTIGKSKSGSNVSITVLVDNVYYTLTGPTEYELVMQTMADSIAGTADEE